MINDEARIQVLDDCKGELQNGIQVHEFFATETASEYKYQIATEIGKQNTSEQVSAKETALRNVYKYSILFFFLNGVSVEK